MWGTDLLVTTYPELRPAAGGWRLKRGLNLQERCLVPSTGQLVVGVPVPTPSGVCVCAGLCSRPSPPPGLEMALANVSPLPLLPAVPLLSSSLPLSFQRGLEARGKQLLLFFPSSRSNVTPTERSSPRGSPCPLPGPPRLLP